jgi:esterase/lipase
MKKNVVLLHGAMGCEADLFPLKEILQQHFVVHTFNFFGHGEDKHIERDFTIEQFTDDLRSYLNENNISSCSIFGYSMGGYVALNYAAASTGIEKIFTLGTKLAWTPEFATKQSKFLNADFLLQKVPAFAAQLEQKHGADKWKTVVAKTAQMMQRLGNQPLLNENTLPKISAECIIALGDKDDMVTRDESEQVVAQLPHASFKILTDTPHPIEKVNAEMLANELTYFFQ